MLWFGPGTEEAIGNILRAVLTGPRDEHGWISNLHTGGTPGINLRDWIVCMCSNSTANLKYR